MYSPPLAALPAASAPAREAKGTDMRKERLFITHLKRAEVFHNSTLSFQRRKLSIRHFGFPNPAGSGCTIVPFVGRESRFWGIEKVGLGVERVGTAVLAVGAVVGHWRSLSENTNNILP